MMHWKSLNRYPIFASLVLLAAVGLETSGRPKPAEAEGYHARIRELADQMPMVIGPWRGTDVPVQAAAQKLLKPNVILSRRFDDGSRSVQFMLVHCKDVRDINGHYPPVCYPAHGAVEESRQAVDWNVDGLTIVGTEYKFSGRPIFLPGSGVPFTSAGQMVSNFIIVPGEYCRDMQQVSELHGDYTKRFFGAAQLQVVFDLTWPWTPAEREEVTQMMIRAHLPIIEQICNGVER